MLVGELNSAQTCRSVEASNIHSVCCSLFQTMVFTSDHVNRACTPNLRLQLKSLLHTRSFFNRFSPNHTLTKAAPNLSLHRRLVLMEILTQDIGVSTRSLPDWSKSKLELYTYLLPEIGNLIDNHKKLSYRECLKECIAEHSVNGSTGEALPAEVVASYVRLIIRKVVPYNFVGNNERGLKKLCMAIVCGTPPISVKQLLYYLPGRLDKGWLSKVTDPVAQLHVALKLLLWLAGEFLPAAVRSVLYGTKGVSSRSQPVYFTKWAWQSKASMALNNMLQCGYLEKLPKEEFSIHTNDTRGLLRFLPKPNGLRPIVVRRITDPDILSKMKKAKLLMRAINPKVLKLDVEWTKFRSVVLEARASGEKGEVFFVRTDVRSAFVTVRHPKILEVLKEHISKLPAQLQVPEIQRSTSLWASRRFHRTTSTQQGSQQSSQNGNDASNTNTTLQVSTSQNPTKPSLVAVSRDSAYKTLLQEINQQVVRFGARDYQMKVGLAQGGPLSNPLCNMTLEDMTKNHLSEFSTSDGRSVLWRVADDFLLLTLSESVAKRFQEVARRGFHSYGWYMNDLKSETNLNNPEIKTVSFSGGVFNLETLEAKAEFAPCSPDSVINTISFKLNFSTVDECYEKLLMSVGSLKLDPLYLNMANLRHALVLKHISTAAKLQALRFRGLTRYLMAHEARDKDACEFVLDALYRTNRMIAWSIRKILFRTAPADTQDIPTVGEIRWLMNVALLQRTAGYTSTKLRNTLKGEVRRLEKQIDPRHMQSLYDAHNSQ